MRDAAIVVAETLRERGANARRVVIGETPDRKRRAIAHRRIRILHQRQQHALRTLVADQILERGGNGPANIRRIVRRDAREHIDRARVLPLTKRMHGRFDDRGIVVARHRQQRLHRFIGKRIQLPEDVGARDTLRRSIAGAELHRALEDFSRTEGVQLLNRTPSRIVILLSNDDREQLVDGMHAPMLPYVSPMRALLLAVTIFFFTACGELKSPTEVDGGGEPIDPTATFTRVQNEIFTPTCAVLGCHDPIGHESDMILTAGRAYDNIVNKPSVEMPSLARIQPNDPANSYLYRKITGAGITGERMPFGGASLSESQIKLVRDWIRRGAPND